MPEGAVIGLLLGAVVIGVAVETLIGAVFLRAAVALYNKTTGGASSADSVPEPAFRKAMRIALNVALAQLVLATGIGLFMAAEPAAPQARGQGPGVVAQASFFVVSFLIMAQILSTMLPTTFGRAVSVTLLYLLVSLLVGGVLGGLAVLVFAIAL
jgi:hypothetical protein